MFTDELSLRYLYLSDTIPWTPKTNSFVKQTPTDVADNEFLLQDRRFVVFALTEVNAGIILLEELDCQLVFYDVHLEIILLWVFLVNISVFVCDSNGLAGRVIHPVLPHDLWGISDITVTDQLDALTLNADHFDFVSSRQGYYNRRRTFDISGCVLPVCLKFSILLISAVFSVITLLV